MLISFDHISDKARVWVYQASRELGRADVDLINAHSPAFVQSWTAHNQQLEAAFSMLDNYFLILAVDETKTEASGCSIDKSVHFIKFLETKLGLSFTDRKKVAVRQEDKISLVDFHEFKKQIKEGNVDRDLRLFNTLARTKREIVSKWLLTLEESPYARFLMKVG